MPTPLARASHQHWWLTANRVYSAVVGLGLHEAIRRKKYAANVEDGYGETIVTARLARDANRCYQRFCAVERVTEWLSVVETITVLDRDDYSRPTRVEFRGTLVKM